MLPRPSRMFLHLDMRVMMSRYAILENASKAYQCHDGTYHDKYDHAGTGPEEPVAQVCPEIRFGEIGRLELFARGHKLDATSALGIYGGPVRPGLRSFRHKQRCFTTCRRLYRREISHLSRKHCRY